MVATYPTEKQTPSIWPFSPARAGRGWT